MWKENHNKLFTSKKSKWFFGAFHQGVWERLRQYGTTASQTPVLSYRPNNVQRAPWCTISLSPPRSDSFFCFTLLFLLHSCSFTWSGGGNWWNNVFFPMRGREKERRGHERVSKEKQKESQRRSDYCFRERAWLTSLSGRKDKQVINAAGRRPDASRSFAYVLPLVFAELTETVLHNSQVTANTHLSFSTADNEGCAKQRAAAKMVMHEHHLRLDFYQLHIELQ